MTVPMGTVPAGTVPAETAARQTRLERWLKINPRMKPDVAAQVYSSADMTDLNYWLEIVFSAGIAALGLVVNSPAVIIGAMLISPLMGPIMATGLGLAAGDLYLAVKAIANLVASVVLAVGLAAFIVWLLPFHSITTEILARINPDLLDLGIALFSGLAGSVAVLRTNSVEGVMTLPGVAIAVALMPPLCTIGYGLGAGMNTRIMGGAGLLFLTNLVAIVASAFAVFLLAGMSAPEVRQRLEQLRKDEPFAATFTQGPLGRALADGGQLRWRILLLAVLLASIAVPLRKAFIQVAGETIIRGTVQDAVRDLLPPEALVSQQVEVGRQSVAVRLISTENVPAAKLEEAEREIERRSGRKTHITISSIASQSELAGLLQRLAPPAPPPPKPKPVTVAELQQQIVERVQPAVDAVWPPEAPLQNFDVQVSPAGVVIDAQYASLRELGKVPLAMIERDLQEKLALPGLTLKATRARDSYRILEEAKKNAAKKPAAQKP
jgi:uncharacterized hydrophobic protein (TIGR00271 family)